MIESTTCGSIKTQFMRKLMTFTIWNVSNVDKDVTYQCSKSFKLFYGKLFVRAVFPYNLFGFRLCNYPFIRIQIINIDKLRDLCSRCLLIFLLEDSSSSTCMFPINLNSYLQILRKTFLLVARLSVFTRPRKSTYSSWFPTRKNAWIIVSVFYVLWNSSSL